LNAPNIVNGDTKETPALKIADLVRKDAKDYTDKGGALTSIEFVKKKLLSISLSTELKELYTLDIKFFQDYKAIPGIYAVAKWLKDNKHDYFAKLTYESHLHEDVGEYITSLSGFELTIDIPFKSVSIDINGHYPNLTSYQCNVAFLISKKLITFFYYISDLIEESWDNKKLNTTGLKWIYTQCKIVDFANIEWGVDTLKAKIEEKINDELNSKFNPPLPGDDLPF
jgi:hypothetical protein